MTYDAGNKIKILVVDDSAFMRKVITDMLNSVDSIQVIDTARNGAEGIEKAKRLKPDIITLDVEMPIMDGLTALKELMELRPVPKVIMLSSLTYEGAEATMKALDLGALDFVTKPTSSIVNFKVEAIREELVKKITDLAMSKQKSLVANKIFTEPKSISKPKTPVEAGKNQLKYIIAIGTSTGGPRALQEVVPYLPQDIPAAVVIVQHMPPGFTKSLAARLDNLSKINVKEAEDGDILKAGWAYLAPGDFHMLINSSPLEGYRISINQDPPVTGHRPSVNAMMESVADCGHNNLIAVMMTGMGSDGSEGILKIKKKGGKTIAQNEETCVVYGMPKSAVNIGAIDKIVPLNEISKEIIKFMGV